MRASTLIGPDSEGHNRNSGVIMPQLRRIVDAPTLSSIQRSIIIPHLLLVAKPSLPDKPIRNSLKPPLKAMATKYGAFSFTVGESSVHSFRFLLRDDACLQDQAITGDQSLRCIM